MAEHAGALSCQWPTVAFKADLRIESCAKIRAAERKAGKGKTDLDGKQLQTLWPLIRELIHL